MVSIVVLGGIAVGIYLCSRRKTLKPASSADATVSNPVQIALSPLSLQQQQQQTTTPMVYAYGLPVQGLQAQPPHNTIPMQHWQQPQQQWQREAHCMQPQQVPATESLAPPAVPLSSPTMLQAQPQKVQQWS